MEKFGNYHIGVGGCREYLIKKRAAMIYGAE